jgi:hypothetical protein
VDPVPDPLLFRFSENLVGPGIEPGTSGSVARNSNHYTTEAVPLLIKVRIILPLLDYGPFCLALAYVRITVHTFLS